MRGITIRKDHRPADLNLVYRKRQAAVA